MRKKIIPLLLSCLLLTACSFWKSDKTNQAQAPKKVSTVQTTESSTTETSTTESSSADVEKTEAYQYESTEGGVKQVIKETLVYKGEKFTKMELHITQEPDAATKERLSGLDFSVVRTQLLEHLDQQAFMQQLKSISGLVVSTDVTQDYHIIIDIKIDMATIDLKALSNVEGVGADFTGLANVTPSAYILGLKLRGAVQVQ